MTHATTFIISVIASVCSAAASATPLVTFESTCVCHNNHGKGPGVHLTQSSKRIAAENKWYALTGRVVDMKVEADGDVHVALRDATGNKPGSVVVEVPAKPRWCPIRKVFFGLTKTKFPFGVRSAKTLKVNQAPVITITGKAFFDINHASKNQSNRRTDLAGYAAWKIHPVMQVTM
jgi:hypothetical protein